jgi:ubiquinone/menaquinone biosynthesis C-methylase UbiE
VENIDLLLGEYHNPHLEPDTVDLLLMVDVYHEFSHPEQMLAGIRRSMKAGGQVVLVEFRAEDDSVPIRPEHKMSKDQIILEMTANGFKKIRSYDELPWQHMLFFEVDVVAGEPTEAGRADP